MAPCHLENTAGIITNIRRWVYAARAAPGKQIVDIGYELWFHLLAFYLASSLWPDEIPTTSPRRSVIINTTQIASKTMCHTISNIYPPNEQFGYGRCYLALWEGNTATVLP